MKRIIFLSFLLTFVGSVLLNAQVPTLTVKGKVISNLNLPLQGASVFLIHTHDSTRYYKISERDGSLEFEDVKPGMYTLRATMIGHQPVEKQVQVNRRNSDLGNIIMAEGDIKLGEVEVTSQMPIGEQLGDTTQYSADAFKTMPDASVEDLVKKMPGVQVEQDGTVRAQGENVQRVLVDGRPFFGNDPTLALKNLPAEVVANVQIYDQMSEQSQLTGFDDGQSVKTMNIVTREEKRTGEFGKVIAGGGTDEKYNASLNINYFKDARRISVLGMSNNINQQNFSPQDILGLLGVSSRFGSFLAVAGRMGPGMMRGGSTGGSRPPGGGVSNFLVGNMSGINNTHSLGLNFSDEWLDKKIEFSGSYFFNMTKNENNQFLDREYFTGEQTSQYFNQLGIGETDNMSNRVNMRIKYDINKNHSLIMTPSLSFQNNKSYNLTASQTYFNDALLVNSSDNDFTSESFGYNVTNDLLYRVRLNDSGRTLSVNFTTGANDRMSENFLFAENFYFANQTSLYDTLNQFTDSPQKGYNLAANAIYTEAIGKKGQLQVTYNASLANSYSDRRTYLYSEEFLDYITMDTVLSNKFDNDYLTQRAGLGYMHRGEKYTLNTSVNYQKADLMNEQTFPIMLDNDYSFYNVLPSMMLNYRFSQTSNLRVFYRTNTNSPSITQLQNVIDNSNPMQLSMGNPDLKQQYSHRLVTRYSKMSSDMTRILMGFIAFSYNTDVITNSYIIARNDTLLAQNIFLPSGGQLTSPINMESSQSIMSFFTYGFPLSMIKSNINFNLGGTYSQTPTLINDFESKSDATNINSGIVLSSNVSRNLDFTLSSKVNFYSTVNSIQKELNNDYTYYTNSLSLNWIVWNGFFMQGDVQNQFYKGLNEQDDLNFTILTFSLGKKFFKNNAGEVKLTMFDVLNENKSTASNVTDFYTEYSRNQVLQQYVMLTFSYNISRF